MCIRIWGHSASCCNKLSHWNGSVTKEKQENMLEHTRLGRIFPWIGEIMRVGPIKNPPLQPWPLHEQVLAVWLMASSSWVNRVMQHASCAGRVCTLQAPAWLIQDDEWETLVTGMGTEHVRLLRAAGLGQRLDSVLVPEKADSRYPVKIHKTPRWLQWQLDLIKTTELFFYGQKKL